VKTGITGDPAGMSEPIRCGARTASKIAAGPMTFPCIVARSDEELASRARSRGGVELRLGGGTDRPIFATTIGMHNGSGIATRGDRRALV